jgi:hypothetical protein
MTFSADRTDVSFEIGIETSGERDRLAFVVPEPTLALMQLGTIAGLGLLSRGRRSKR